MLVIQRIDSTDLLVDKRIQGAWLLLCVIVMVLSSLTLLYLAR